MLTLSAPIASQGPWTSPKHEGHVASPRALVLTNETPDRSRPTKDRWDMLGTGVDMPDRTVDRQFQLQTVEQCVGGTHGTGPHKRVD